VIFGGRKHPVPGCDAVFSGGLFDTMKAQQAVAIRFCWKARHTFGRAFFL
jgi:hypothetical protein